MPPILLVMLALLCAAHPLNAATILFEHGIIHTVSGETITNGSILVQDGKITQVIDETKPHNSIIPNDATNIDLKGQHVYPGLIALDSSLGLAEIEAVRATRDTSEVGDYTPDVQSWIAVNADSELIPVARANGIAYFEPAPHGNIVAGQSALLACTGWTYEQMTIRNPIALHLFWPSMELNLTPKEKAPDAAKLKSLDDQAKERHAKVQSLKEFFDDAKAYAKAKDADTKSGTNSLEKVPAWEAMLPYVRGELPVVIHADEARQIKAAVDWAASNQVKAILAGGRDAWMFADMLATNHIPVIYEGVFVPPARDTEVYDVHFHAPEILRAAGVKFAISLGQGGFAATQQRNLPYTAAQAIAFGLPENDALKAITLTPAQLAGSADRLGSIEIGKDATFFVYDGNLFDIRSNVKRMWITGQEVSLESRHTRLYEKFRNRPQ